MKQLTKDLVSKMYKQLIQVNARKKKTNQKMGKRPKQTFLPSSIVGGENKQQQQQAEHLIT